MLKLLRRKGVAKKISWVIAIVIIILFGFGGTAYLVTNQFNPNYAGKIFGKKISLQDYQKAFQQVQTQAMMRYGDNFKQIQQFMDFDTDTWNRIILLHEAQRRRIKVSDDEVVETIAAYPFFARNGQFDTLLYNDILRFYFHMRPPEFEDAVRDDIRIRKIFETATADVQIKEEDALVKYKVQNDQVQVQYILVEPDTFIKDVPFDETRAQEIYAKNPSAFEKAPSINVSYIKIPFPVGKIAETTNEADPTTTETELTPEETIAKNDLRQQAETITQEIQNGAPFDQAAEKFKVVAQETGFFSSNQPNLTPGWSFNTLNYLFQADINETLGPIETEDAFLIVQLKDRQEASIASYEEAQEQVREMTLKEAAAELANTKANEYLSALSNLLAKNPELSFPDAAAQLDLSVQVTPTFNRGQYLPTIGISSEFQEAAFSLNEQRPLAETLVETPAGTAILYLDKTIPVSMEQFEKDKTAFIEKLQNEATNKVFNEFLTELRKQSHFEDNIANLRQKQEAQQQNQ